jgi:hypothetical protein
VRRKLESPLEGNLPGEINSGNTILANEAPISNGGQIAVITAPLFPAAVEGIAVAPGVFG